MTQPLPQQTSLPQQPPPAQQPPLILPPPVVVDGIDEADFNAMEVAIGAAIAALLIVWLTPGPNSIFGDHDSWRRQILERAGLTLRNFIARSAQDFAAATDVADASAIAAAATDEAYTEVADALARWSEQTLHRLTTQDVADGQLSEQARKAAENLTRATTTYARNEVRDRVAGRVGAVWSGWRTRHDDRVRETHQGLNGTWVPFGGRFVTETGVALRRPGDPEAPLEETMGCRCHLVYRLKPTDDYAGV